MDFPLEFLHNYSPIHQPLWHSSSLNVGGILEPKPSYVQWILSSEQLIRGKIPLRKMKLKTYFQFSLLRYIMHLCLLLH